MHRRRRRRKKDYGTNTAKSVASVLGRGKEMGPVTLTATIVPVPITDRGKVRRGSERKRMAELLARPILNVPKTLALSSSCTFLRVKGIALTSVGQNGVKQKMVSSRPRFLKDRSKPRPNKRSQ